MVVLLSDSSKFVTRSVVIYFYASLAMVLAIVLHVGSVGSHKSSLHIPNERANPWIEQEKVGSKP